MRVPKAAVRKDNSATARKHKVRASGQLPVVQPLSHQHLGLGVAPADAAYVGMALLRADRKLKGRFRTADSAERASYRNSGCGHQPESRPPYGRPALRPRPALAGRRREPPCTTSYPVE